MLKKTLNCVISLFLPWCTLTLNAQSDLPRFETAGQFGLGNLLIRFPGQNSNNLIMTARFGLRFSMQVYIIRDLI